MIEILEPYIEVTAHKCLLALIDAVLVAGYPDWNNITGMLFTQRRWHFDS